MDGRRFKVEKPFRSEVQLSQGLRVPSCRCPHPTSKVWPGFTQYCKGFRLRNVPPISPARVPDMFKLTEVTFKSLYAQTFGMNDALLERSRLVAAYSLTGLLTRVTTHTVYNLYTCTSNKVPGSDIQSPSLLPILCLQYRK